MSEQVNNGSQRFSTGAWLELAAEVLRVAGETMQPEKMILWLRPAATQGRGRK